MSPFSLRLSSPAPQLRRGRGSSSVRSFLLTFDAETETEAPVLVPDFFPSLSLEPFCETIKINYLAWSEEVNERWTVRMCKPTCEDLILTASLLPETDSFSFPTILFVRVFNPFQSEAECFLAASILLQSLAPVFLVLSILFFLSASPPPLWPLPSLFSLPLHDSRELSPFELDPELRLLLSLKQRIIFISSHIQLSKLILSFNWHHHFLSVWFSLMSKPTFNQLNCVWPRVIFGQIYSELLCFLRTFMCYPRRPSSQQQW